MKLADEVVSVDIEGTQLTLRASLRAATRLAHHYGDFGVILRAITNGELGVIARVIEETSTDQIKARNVLEHLWYGPLRTKLERLIPALVEIVLKLANVDDTDDPDTDPSGPRLSLEEYHATLFRIATGWLGWHPETAWNATAPEILAAHQGRAEMLRAIFGGGDEDEEKPARTPHFERDEEGFATLRAMSLSGANGGA